MSEPALIRVYEDRPATVRHRGGVVYVGVHDQSYLSQKAAWKQKLAEAHPDRGGNDLRFHRVKRQRDRWEASEKAWYAEIGLEPPIVERDDARITDARTVRDLVPSRHGRNALRMKQAADYLAEHPTASPSEFASALGISVDYGHTLRYRLKREQARPEQPLTAPQRILSLLADGRSHDSHEVWAVAGRDPGIFMSRLRRRGFDIRFTPPFLTRRPTGAYRLLGRIERNT